MKRNFNYPTLSMLVAALTVAENFSSFKADFVNEKPNWKILTSLILLLK